MVRIKGLKSESEDGSPPLGMQVSLRLLGRLRGEKNITSESEVKLIDILQKKLDHSLTS